VHLFAEHALKCFPTGGADQRARAHLGDDRTGGSVGGEGDREIIEAYWAALARKDFDGALAYVDEDFEERYPQSGEVIRGRRNFEGLLKNFPGFPSIEHGRTIGGGDVWFSELEFDYGGEMAGQKWRSARSSRCATGS